MSGRQTATAAERGFRRFMREYGFRCEAVSWVRGAGDDSHTEFICWPATNVASLVNVLTDPRQRTVEITRIHIGRPHNGHSGEPQPPTARVYVRWATLEAAPTIAEMDADLEHPPAKMTGNDNSRIRKHLSI